MYFKNNIYFENHFTVYKRGLKATNLEFVFSELSSQTCVLCLTPLLSENIYFSF